MKFRMSFFNVILLADFCHCCQNVNDVNICGCPFAHIQSVVDNWFVWFVGLWFDRFHKICKLFRTLFWQNSLRGKLFHVNSPFAVFMHPFLNPKNLCSAIFTANTFRHLKNARKNVMIAFSTRTQTISIRNS